MLYNTCIAEFRKHHCNIHSELHFLPMKLTTVIIDYTMFSRIWEQSLLTGDSSMVSHGIRASVILPHRTVRQKQLGSTRYRLVYIWGTATVSLKVFFKLMKQVYVWKKVTNYKENVHFLESFPSLWITLNTVGKARQFLRQSNNTEHSCQFSIPLSPNASTKCLH